MNANRFKRGSEWRKWDLHIHTPLSIVQKYGGPQQWDAFIESLERLPEDVKVVGINDYYFIDGYKKVMEYRNAGRLQNIEKIFPILEFRIDTFGSGNENRLQKINLHILLDLDESNMDSEIEKVNRELISQIPISGIEKYMTKSLSRENFAEAGGDLQTGFSSLVPPTKKVFEILESPTWKDRVFLFLGYKEWSNLDKNAQLKPLKEDLYNKVNAFFTSNAVNLGASKTWLDEYGNKPLLHSCDIHDFEYLDTARKDANGSYLPIEKYHCHTWIKADPTFQGLRQIIYEPELRVTISAGSPADQYKKFRLAKIRLTESSNFPVVDQFLDVNRDLVAVIGGRGSGKSALFESIAHCFDKHDTPRTEGTSRQEGGRRYGNRSFIDHYKNEGSDYKLELIFENLDSVAMPSYTTTLQGIGPTCSYPILYLGQNKIEQYAQNPEDIHNLALDTVMKNTTQSERLTAIKGQIDQAGKELVDLNKEIEALRSKMSAMDIDAIRQEKARVDAEIQLLSSEETRGIIDEFGRKREKKDHLARMESVIGDLDGNSTDNIGKLEAALRKFETETAPLIQEANDNARSLNDQVDPLILDLSVFRGAILEMKKSIDKAQINADYNAAVKEIEERLKGKTDMSVSYLESQRSRSSEISERLAQATALQTSLGDKIRDRNERMGQFHRLYEAYRALYQDAIDEFWQNNQDILRSIRLTARVYFKGYDIVDKLYRYADGRKARSYESFAADRLGIEDPENFDLIAWINGFKSDEENFNVFTNMPENLFDEIVFTDHFSLLTEAFYEIAPGHSKPLNQLSLGQKGTVLLKFYLSSGNNCPILIDQPEDHLDNDFIYRDLVKTVRAAKMKRQIIVVTHDANIVVNGDAEQVIVAQYNDQAIDHGTSGALENPQIRDFVSRILEGGKEAFQKREQKYNYNG